MDPLRVDPAAVPDNAVRVMRRTLLRHADSIAADPQDEELARLIVAVVIAALAQPVTEEAAAGSGTESRFSTVHTAMRDDPFAPGRPGR